MSAGARGAGQDPLRFMVAGEGESGPRIDDGDKAKNVSMSAQVKNKPHAKAKKPSATQAQDNSQPLSAGPVAKAEAARNKKAQPIRLGNFERLITTTLRKSPELLLEDGEFPKIVQKGAQEIIQALHKTNDRVVLKKHLEQFTRCERLLKELNSKLVTLIGKTAKNDHAKRGEIAEVAGIVNAALIQFKNEAPFLEAFKPRAIPNTVIGLMASFLPEEEVDTMLDPLLDQFASQSERAPAKAAATKEAYKGDKLAKEVSAKIREALIKEGDNFVFPKELKDKIQQVTALDLSKLAGLLSLKAMKELFSNCPHLTSLNLDNNPVTKEMMDLLVGELKELRHLNLHETDINDSTLAIVAGFGKLQDLDCGYCRRLTTLPSFASCPELQSLNCENCPSIINWAPVASCKKLQSLNLHNNYGVTKELMDLLVGELKELRHLNLHAAHIDNATSIDDNVLASIAKFVHLQSLNCNNCYNITTLKPLASCKNLQDLDCSWCAHITTLEPLAFCKKLQNLYIHECVKITTLEPLASCPELQRLFCRACYGITTLEPLKHCLNLQEVDCTSCSITTLEPLAYCPELQSLTCRSCLKITTLEPLKHCLKLRSLNCFSCYITTLEPLTFCRKLQNLRCGGSRYSPLTSAMLTALRQALPELKVELVDGLGWK